MGLDCEEEMREWRPIFRGKYAVSNDGRVKNAQTGRVLALTRMKIGYLKVSPVWDGRNVYSYVHRLVAEAFIGPRRGREVNHRDGNKRNNDASNLEYVSHAGNMAHAANLSLMARGESHPAAKMTSATVRALRSARDGGHSYSNLARMFRISIATAFNIANRKTWKHV